jgi:DNA-binding HxlR family transcriptional regulator
MTKRNARRLAPPEHCPLDLCLKFLSSTWTTRIIWFLSCGSRRFGDLRRDLGNISTKVLTQRLRTMEARGVILRTALPTSPAKVEYSLTTLGREFQPVLDAMIAVAGKLGRDHYSLIVRQADQGKGGAGRRAPG